MQLRDGTELLGRYEGSAYEQPTYLVRRDDGQVIHLSHLLYLVALSMDGERGLAEIADQLSTEIGRQVVADNVEYLVEEKLRPLGLIATDTDTGDVRSKSLPLLALRYRTRVIPPRLHRGVTTALQPLFWPPVIVLVLAGVAAVNIWLFGTHRTDLTRAVHGLPFHPGLFLLVTVLVLFSGFFHEIGHATATRYGGGSPGVMGVGIYLAWPAFYTDLTDSYRLDRRGRLRSDLGGVYFNAVLIVAAGLAYVATGFAPLVVFVVVSQVMAVYQFLPFIRLDGYYIMSDLVGVPNLFAYLGPVLKSLFRRLDPSTDAQLRLLKRRARTAIQVWSVVTVAFLAFNFAAIAVLAPVIITAEWASVHLQSHAMFEAFTADNVASGLNDGIDLLLVAAGPLGMLLVAGLLLRRAFQAVRRWWPRHRIPALALAALLATALASQGQVLASRLATPRGAVTIANGTRPPAAVHKAPHPALPPDGRSATPLVSAPSGPDRLYLVQPNDTLWEIAARLLGDPERWPAIFDLNAGLPQPDGRALSDPDRIYPGWTLRLPGSTAVAALITPASPPTDQARVVPRPSEYRPAGQAAPDTFDAVGGAPPATVAPSSSSSSGAASPPSVPSAPAPPPASPAANRSGGGGAVRAPGTPRPGEGVGGQPGASATTLTRDGSTGITPPSVTGGCISRLTCPSVREVMAFRETVPAPTTDPVSRVTPSGGAGGSLPAAGPPGDRRVGEVAADGQAPGARASGAHPGTTVGEPSPEGKGSLPL